LQALLDDLELRKIQIAEIHFFVEPPLFDLPFNRIERRPGGDLLGGEAVVLLNYRRPPNFLEFWRDYAESLRCCEIDDVKLIEISVDTNRRTQALRDKGLCYTSFVFNRDAKHRTLPTEEQKIMLQVLKSGAPYICWLQRAPSENNWHRGLETSLRGLLRQQQSLVDFPKAIFHERIKGDVLINNASLLWDDPNFDPFFVMSGIDDA
jgi:hypothetical protein